MKKKIKQVPICYFQDMVESCPDIRLGFRTIGNKSVEVVALFKNKKRVEVHQVNTARGKELIRIREEREYYKKVLMQYQSEWVDLFSEPCERIKIRHYGNTQNRKLFDSLCERKNTYKFDSSVFYQGREYRSKLEGDFAKLMDEHGIMYKYEPRIELKGNMVKYPDFVIYLPWLDLLILVEIFGKCSDTGYLEENKGKIHDYITGGWVPGYNMLTFFYTGKTPYIREMIMEEIENIEMRKCMTLSRPR